MIGDTHPASPPPKRRVEGHGVVMRRLVASLVASLLACGAPTVDGSSPETLATSIEELERELFVADRTRLEEALRAIVARELGRAMRGDFGAASGASEVDRRVAERLHDRTAEEIIAQAEDLRAERRSSDAAAPP